MLVTLYRTLRLVLSRAIRIGEIEGHVWGSNIHGPVVGDNSSSSRAHTNNFDHRIMMGIVSFD